MKRVLITGGRDFSNYTQLENVLDSYALISALCHGGASGADSLAGIWAKRRCIPCTIFWANWDKYGKGAGLIRNQQMLEEFKPDMVIAFPGGSGTADMVKRAKAAGVLVVQIDKIQ